MLSLLFSITIASLNLEQDNLIKVLRYQYEQELKNLRIENAKLQQKVYELESKLKNSAQSAKEVTKPKPASSEDDMKLYSMALEAVSNEEWNDAILLLEQLVNSFPSSQYADNSIFLMAQVYQFKGQTELARIELLRLMEKYPKSERYSAAMEELNKIERFQSSKNQ